MYSYLSTVYSLILGGMILVPLLRRKYGTTRITLLVGMIMWYACTSNLCISFHNELDVGVQVQGNLVTISSTFMRWIMVTP